MKAQINILSFLNIKNKETTCYLEIEKSCKKYSSDLFINFFSRPGWKTEYRLQLRPFSCVGAYCTVFLVLDSRPRYNENNRSCRKGLDTTVSFDSINITINTISSIFDRGLQELVFFLSKKKINQQFSYFFCHNFIFISFL